MDNLNISWVDFAVVLLLIVGLWRGRKRGMSEEVLDVTKWALIVLIAGLGYQPCAQVIMSFTSVFSPLSMYVSCYLAIAIIITIIFSVIRKHAGEKIVGSDTFGSAEYYLGMLAGTARYACIILVAFSFLNAPHYTPEEIKAKKKYQDDNFGTTFFMTVPDFQKAVFKDSLLGRTASEYLQVVFIRPTAGGGKDLAGGDNAARARERSVNSSLDLR